MAPTWPTNAVYNILVRFGSCQMRRILCREAIEVVFRIVADVMAGWAFYEIRLPQSIHVKSPVKDISF